MYQENLKYINIYDYNIFTFWYMKYKQGVNQINIICTYIKSILFFCITIIIRVILIGKYYFLLDGIELKFPNQKGNAL